nr:hypothetical protein [uncultured Olsenella sp.]
MAIQMRRGPYTQFDPSRLLPGEWAVVEEDAPDATGGRAAYMCFAPGEVKRVATVEDMATIIANAEPELVHAVQRVAEDNEAARVRAESARAAAEGARVQAEQVREASFASAADSAEQRTSAAVNNARSAANDARGAASAARSQQETNNSQQAENNRQQEANNRAAQGMTVRVLTQDQVSGGPSTTRKPSVTGEPGVMYLAPNAGDLSPDDDNYYAEWLWVNGEWERVGTDWYDTYAHREHEHSASDVTTGTLPVERGGTGAPDASAARANLQVPGTVGVTDASMEHASSNYPADLRFSNEDGSQVLVRFVPSGVELWQRPSATAQWGVTWKSGGMAPGDVTVVWYGAGYVTGDGMFACCNVPLDVTPSNTVSLVGGGARFRQNGKYVFGSSSSPGMFSTLKKTECTAQYGSVRVAMEKSSAYDGIQNNDSIGIDARFIFRVR